MADDYRYAGLTLTPALFAALVRELAPGRLIRRSEAIELVRGFHESNGGAATLTNVSSTAKKVFSNLVKDGWAEPAGSVGHYRVSGIPETSEDPFQEPDDLDAELVTTSTQYVYAYYLPTYAEAAALRGEDEWPHKIGMTTTAVPDRLRNQVGTALPEVPVIARVFACDDAALLERAFHSVLELKGRKIRGVPGNEWYLTNGTQIDAIANFVEWSDPDGSLTHDDKTEQAMS